MSLLKMLDKPLVASSSATPPGSNVELDRQKEK